MSSFLAFHHLLYLSVLEELAMFAMKPSAGKINVPYLILPRSTIPHADPL